ncbi:MAG: hypothetical protein KF901_29955 [Myxococcales bacterium]|nr:hypothetical protein [Myxococcales bacterium]
MKHGTHTLSWLVLLALAACGAPDFSRRSEVEYPRTLAIVLDPPVVRPGQMLTARALVVTPEGHHLTPTGSLATDADGGRRCDGDVCFEWSVCLRRERGLESTTYEPEVPSQGCDDASGDEGFGATAMVDADGTLHLDTSPLATAIQLGALDAIARALGIPAAIAEEILQRTGIPIVVELRVFAFGEAFVAYKQALVLDDGCEADCLGTNPPAPQLAIWPLDDRQAPRRWVTGRGVAQPFECVPCERADDGTCAPSDAPIRLQPNRRYVLDPEKDVADWIEPYTVLTVTGDFVTLEESGYFAFFSNAGRLQEQRTQHPATEEIFRTPAEPGEVTLWVVTRDGHYGMSACRLRVEVAPSE